MSNRAMGSQGEKRLAEMLSARGWWVHLLQQNAAGQPCDIIAVDSEGRGYLIDSKVCSRGRFDLERIEPNQESVAIKWGKITGRQLWFALWVNEYEVFMVSYGMLMIEKRKFSSLPESRIREIGIPFGAWV